MIMTDILMTAEKYTKYSNGLSTSGQTFARQFINARGSILSLAACCASDSGRGMPGSSTSALTSGSGFHGQCLNVFGVSTAIISVQKVQSSTGDRAGVLV